MEGPQENEKDVKIAAKSAEFTFPEASWELERIDGRVYQSPFNAV